jgi:PAS domain S-box-containing protein
MLFALVGMGPILSLFLSIFFIRGISKPISALLLATRKVREGDISHRITGLKDEFGEVADSFNIMTNALGDQLIKAQQEEERYRAALNQSLDHIFLVDIETKRIVEANPAMALMLGYSSDELIDMTLYDIEASDPEDIDKRTDEIVTEQRRYIGECMYRKKDASLIEVEASANVIIFGSRKLLCVLARDITERKNVEAALRESEQKYRILFESAGDAIFILEAEGDNTGKIISANPAAAEMHGYSIEELLSMNIRDLDIPHDAKEVPTRIDQILDGKWVNVEVGHLRKDGTSFPLEVSAGLMEIGNRKYILAFDRDISKRNEAEKALKRVEHLKTVGELAAGLVHEMKNPLTGIKMSMEVFSQELDLDEEDRFVLIKIIAEINRMELLMKSLLNFARPPQPHFMTVDINFIIRKTLILAMDYPSFNQQKSKSISIVESLDANIPPSLADPLQLQQVFLNLFMNSADSMPEGGEMSVSTKFSAEAGTISITVADVGPGIRDELIDKIFSPFFTTKARGYGLGLAITKQLIEQHGGTISVSNRSGRGAIFTIVLPFIKSTKGQPVWQSGEEYLL